MEIAHPRSKRSVLAVLQYYILQLTNTNSRIIRDQRCFHLINSSGRLCRGRIFSKAVRQGPLLLIENVPQPGAADECPGRSPSECPGRSPNTIPTVAWAASVAELYRQQSLSGGARCSVSDISRRAQYPL